MPNIILHSVDVLNPLISAVIKREKLDYSQAGHMQTTSYCFIRTWMRKWLIPLCLRNNLSAFIEDSRVNASK